MQGGHLLLLPRRVVGLPPDLDLTGNSKQSKFLLRQFCKHVSELNLDSPGKVKISEVLQAISPKLAPRIPGWKELGVVHLSKKAPTYRRVYQRVANYMRHERAYLTHVAAFGGSTTPLETLNG